MRHIVMILDNPYTHDARVRQEVKSLTQAGLRVTVVCWDRENKFPLREDLDGAHVERIYLLSGRIVSFRQLPQLLSFWLLATWRAVRLAPDYIHSHDFDGLVPGVLANLILRKRLIYDAHESFPDSLTNRFSPRAVQLAARIEGLLLRRVDRVIAVSDRLSESLKRRGAHNVTVVGNWKRREDFDFPEEMLQQRRRELKLDRYNLVVGYLGILSPDRSIVKLIEVARRCEDVGFLIGGYGPLAPTIEQASQQLPNLCYIGLVPATDVPLYTKLVDVVFYCLTLDYAGGYYSSPNKLFEALAGSKALVVTHGIGEVGAVVSETGCGIAVKTPEVDEITKAFDLLRDPAVLQAMQQRSLYLCKTRFNWELAEQRLLDVYKG